MANVLMVIAPDQFRDEELFVTKERLEELGHTTRVVSEKTGTIQGVKGGTFPVDTLVSQINSADYDALVFIGGGGAKVYFDDFKILGMAREMYEAGKVVAAICIAPVILANAGILEGKNATVFETGTDMIKEKGANFVEQGVVVDGNIVTADGPQSASGFAEKIDELL